MAKLRALFEMLRQIEPRTACWEHSVTEKTQTAFKISNGSLRVAPEPTYRQAPAPSAVALGAGSVANQANTVSVGSVGNERRITNVAAGISSTDAVNVSQLSNLASGVQSQFNGVQNQFNGIQNQFNGLQNQVNGIQNQVTDNWREARGGVALALAAGGLRFDNRPGKWSVAGAYGNFKGMSGLAFGLGYAVTDRLRFNATVSGAPELGSMGGVVSGSFTLN